MSGIYTEENGKYQIDLTNALYSIGDLGIKYAKTIGGMQSDVDWIAETEDAMILIEFKSYEKEGTFPKYEQEKGEQLYQKILKKYYGTVFFLMACGKKKPIYFIWILESPHMDSFVRKKYFQSIKKRLPFELQKLPEIKVKLIENFKIMSVKEWNEEYSQFPLTKIT
ncbi:MAG: hypothetical protein FWC91_06480 [Defluviitaleaceae bacterium]|nr:hypothetical protein [Defluviitaleaceae bacterium]